MNQRRFSDRIGNIDDRLVQQAEQIPNYARQNRKKTVRRFSAMAAVIALMACSFTAGAIAFAKETIVEVPVKSETVSLEEIGVTLILPDSWEGRYEVIPGRFGGKELPMWEFCVKEIYDARVPFWDGAGEDEFYRGTLFSVVQYEDKSISQQEFADSYGGDPGPNRYLFATENATYIIIYPTDVQFSPDAPEQAELFNAFVQEMKDIQVVLPGAIGSAGL